MEQVGQQCSGYTLDEFTHATHILYLTQDLSCHTQVLICSSKWPTHIKFCHILAKFWPILIPNQLLTYSRQVFSTLAKLWPTSPFSLAKFWPTSSFSLAKFWPTKSFLLSDLQVLSIYQSFELTYKFFLPRKVLTHKFCLPSLPFSRMG